MSKWIKLLGSAYVNGVLRHAHEGVLHLEDDEADRLLDNELGEDVSDDFKGKDAKDAPTESVTVVSGHEPTSSTSEPHQSEVAPQAADDAKAAKGRGKE